MNASSIQLVAHRGYMELFPENCWTGLKAAIEIGAQWIEFDIQMCTPGHFVLLHDADFQRTANIPLSVFNISEQQLQTISVHEPERLKERYAPEPVISLNDLLGKLTDYPRARAMVEIKEESLEHWGLEQVMQPLLSILEPFKTQCVLISFSLDALQYAKHHSDLEIGWVLRRYDKASLATALELKPEFLICNHIKLPDNQPAVTGPWQWMLYDITDPELAKQWKKCGIDMVETRDIGSMINHPLLAGDQ